jgi:putative endopeptidase
MRKLSSLCFSIGLLATSLVAGEGAKPSRGVDPKNMDLSVKPCDDFFRYANGAWLKANPIPADQTIWGGFSELGERNRNVLHDILEEASKSKAPKGSLKQKVGDFYASGMDEAAIEKAGLKPLEADLKRIAALKDDKDVAKLLAEGRRIGLGGSFGFFVGQDPKESTRYIGQLNQGGLGLPDRDYYTKDDAKSKELREKYVAHLTKMFELMGDATDAAKKNADTVMALETRLAKASMTRVEMRDPNKVYNKMNLAKLEELAPNFSWKSYFGAMGVADKLGDLNVRQPGFFAELSAATKETPLADWKTWLRWNLIRGNASELSSAFVNESFAFYGTTLSGQKEMQPRWKRMSSATDSALGEALGQLYVDRAFSPKAKTRMLELVGNLKVALRERIQKLEWMTDATKQQALRKLEAFRVKIGYPDAWKDYSKVEINRASFLQNVRAARSFEINRNLAKLGKPIDRTEWGMTPPTVNAYYSPTMNEIVFPAGILQPPFFDPEADDAVNYGGIGMVIGHEMTHGFDDQGSQFDADGNLRNWWQPEDRKAYTSRTDLVVKQFETYEPLQGQKINGKLTLGENIADLGGLKIAFEALKASMKGKPEPKPIDGFTWQQRFFLGAAQIWRNNIREEALRLRLNTDPHSPGEFRVVGPLSNLPEFFDAFGCGDGTKMRRPDSERPAIW